MAQLFRACQSLYGQMLTKGFSLTSTIPGFSDVSSFCYGRSMATLNQIHRAGPPKFKTPLKRGVLDGRPFLRGVVLKTMIKKPVKPNSANRKCVRVKLSNGKEATAYVPGEGHNLQEHSIVLVRGGRTQDLPGVKLKCVRGKYDLAHVKK
ncbi:hypothetical protein SNE40_009392 [Patella caerulea]|uniref:Small ribosomal subunit protein uS12m n=1 Tax=Patella caerulea TaxID=87958 RepID=A0AAN8JVE0_PATCE